MADSVQLPTAEGGRPSGKGGTNWLLIGAMGVGALVLIMLMLRGSSSSTSKTATTSAGTSINAALGSVEEENLNIMGQVSKMNADLSSQLGGVNDNVIVGNQGITGLQSQAAAMASTNASNWQSAGDAFKNLYATQTQGQGTTDAYILALQTELEKQLALVSH